MATMTLARRPKVLITGFPAFPGAPVNPTEWLVSTLNHEDVETAVIPCVYAEVGSVLEGLGRKFDPDIVIHFGLSRQAEGFVLEARARNACRADLLDNSGLSFGTGPISAFSPEFVPASLPNAEICLQLKKAGYPADISDDAGGYLCNFAFYHSAGRLIPVLRSKMIGFVHVPPFTRMPKIDLLNGTGVIIKVCCDVWGETGLQQPCDPSCESPHLDPLLR